MRTFLILPLLAACSGGSYDQKDSDDLIGHDDTDTATDSDADTDTDADSDSDADTDTDADSDTDADTDTDTTPTTDLCTNSWDPLDQGYWIRYYDATYQGEAATGQQEGYGPSHWNGVDAWQYYDEITAGSGSGYAGYVYAGCDWGGNPGLYNVGWDMSINMLGFPLTGTTEPDRPRMYMPAEADMGTVGTWSFSYSESISFSGLPLTLTFSGTYTERGTEVLRLPDGTDYNAYHLSVAYEEDLGGLASYSGTIDQWYVNGLGLVRETSYQTDNSTGTSTELMTREITSWSGLTPR